MENDYETALTLAIDHAINETNKTVTRLIVKQYKDICNTAIQRFYDDYDRLFYTPHKNLFNCFKVIVKSNTITLHIDTDYMSEIYERGMTAKKIYMLTMEQGYHGGAYGDTPDRSGLSKPKDTPYWRTPMTKFTYWGREAFRSDEAPMDEIILNLKEIDGYALYMNTYQKNLVKYLKQYDLL